MRIVVLEGRWNGLEASDSSWDGLRALGDLVAVYPYTTDAQAPARVANGEIFVTGRTHWTEQLFEAAPHAQLLVTVGTGFDQIDLAAARKHGVTVCNVPAYAEHTVAQTAMALLLELTNHVAGFDAAVRAGDWDASRAICSRFPVMELYGKTMGIVGMGHIGQNVARMAEGFGMDVLFYDRRLHPERETPTRKQVPLEELLSHADVVSLHCAASPSNHHLMDAAAFARMKPTAFFINTARGSLVNTAALVAALEHGTIAGAGLDVLEVEPPSLSDPLFKAPNLIVTPHMAWMATDALARLRAGIEDNIRGFLSGHPVNVVSH